jgi:hypothetical protein
MHYSFFFKSFKKLFYCPLHCSTRFGHPCAHHQEPSTLYCIRSLWYRVSLLWLRVLAVLFHEPEGLSLFWRKSYFIELWSWRIVGNNCFNKIFCLFYVDCLHSGFVEQGKCPSECVYVVLCLNSFSIMIEMIMGRFLWRHFELIWLWFHEVKSRYLYVCESV